MKDAQMQIPEFELRTTERHLGAFAVFAVRVPEPVSCAAQAAGTGVCV